MTNFKLILEKDNNKTLSKASQVVKDEEFEKLGVFARQVKVDNIFQGIENIASTFGFSGVEPNTIMMGWPRELNNSADYGKMTEKLLHLDYNLLYLDFDRKKKFGDYKTVDLWWRETDSKNVEMMLNIARLYCNRLNGTKQVSGYYLLTIIMLTHRLSGRKLLSW